MKKTLIAGAGVAAFGLAVLPVAGVFAANPASVVDTLTVKINESCTFEATRDGSTVAPDETSGVINRAFEKNDATLGEVVTLGGASNQGVPAGQQPITVAATCNSEGSSTGGTTPSWTITAKSSETMSGIDGTTGSIPNATTGNEALTSGPTSAWSMKIAAPTTGIQNDYDDYHVMPSSATGDAVLTGTPNATADTTFTPEYRVYVGTDQASGTYRGTVTYTIAATWE